MIRSAVISKDGLYRYTLRRVWDESKPLLNFVLLNPSKADAETDDATVRRCIGFAKLWGFGGIVITNLYAYRSTDPKKLWRVFAARMVRPTPESLDSLPVPVYRHFNAVYNAKDLEAVKWISERFPLVSEE